MRAEYILAHVVTGNMKLTSDILVVFDALRRIDADLAGAIPKYENHIHEEHYVRELSFEVQVLMSVDYLHRRIDVRLNNDEDISHVPR